MNRSEDQFTQSGIPDLKTMLDAEKPAPTQGVPSLKDILDKK